MKVEKLTTAHDRSTFRCGRDELDEWLLTAAMQAGQRNRSALASAVHDVLAAAEHVGIVLMTVDALDEAAAAFTARFGFVRLETQRTRPALAARIKDLRATLGR